MTFRELKKAAVNASVGELKVAVVGDCATQMLTVALKGALAARGVAAQVWEADYNQVGRQLRVSDSELHRFAPALVVVWECVERWWVSNDLVEERLSRVAEYAEHFSGKLLYLNAAPFDDGVFGSYAATDESFPVRVRKFNAGLDELCRTHKNLSIVDLNTLVSMQGRNNGFAPSLYMMSDMPLSLDMQAVLAERIAAVISAHLGKAKKCVILDLDNTLWGGIVGEDGLEGIQLGDHGVGKAFVLFQKMLKRLKDRGVILAVCSKNDEAIAREPFEKHPDMVLKTDDIACFVANWNTKADNVAHIQKILNIGFDSMVFLDDNPAEREIVRMAHPEVLVPELPSDPAEWVAYLASGGCFETVTYSTEDAGRTKTYQEEAKRRAWESTFTSEDDFLRGLEMKASATPFDSFSIPRAAQLTQRSNQFNLRTKRYSESDLESFVKRDDVLTLAFHLSDKFGDYGLVSVMIGVVRGDELFLDTWLMSCRVLKRGLEDFALNAIVRLAAERGIKYVTGEYIPTRKNIMVSDLLDKKGFVKSKNGYRLTVTDYKERKHYIHEQVNH